MFFNGTLQEGIANALQLSRSVVCFVTDSGTESQQWEDEFFKDDKIESVLESQAVVLRLEAGSQEEGFLTQLYPIPKKPTVIIIKNGELKEYIAAGVSNDDFVRRALAVLELPTVPPAAVSEPTPSPQATPATASSVYPQAIPRIDEPATESSSGQNTPPSSNESTIQSILAERAARLAAQKKKDDEEAKRQRAEKAKAKADAEAADPSSKNSQSKHADELKKRQKEAREERQRILKAIEDDKIARRQRQAEKAAERQATATATAADNTEKGKSLEPSAPFAPASQLLPSTGRLHERCAIQVRLLDGSTIRSRFSSTTDTVEQVREWVDGARTDGKAPYTFKILLTPLPSKPIGPAEESESLQALGLAPSSTLIMVPAVGKKRSAAAQSVSGEGVAEAGQGGGGAGEEGEGNILTRFIAFVLGIINAVVGLVSAFFGTLFSVAGPPAPVERAEREGGRQVGASSSSSTTTGRDRGGRVKGLERQRRSEKRGDEQQQFYNGNSTNFQPRRDEDDE